MAIRTIDIAWAAGFLEGEGSVIIPKNKTASPQVSAVQVQLEPLERLCALFGGAIYSKPARGNRQACYSWRTIRRPRAVEILMTIYSLMSPTRKEHIKSVLDTWRNHCHRTGPWKTVCKQGHLWVRGARECQDRHRRHDNGACAYVGALFSGLPKALRNEGILAVLQAWFDESGKGQEPVFLLAGYVGKKTMWEDFADDWQAELERSPRLPYLHAKESQLFKGLTPKERIARLATFVELIEKYKPTAIACPIKHSDHRQFFRIASTHPAITPAERHAIKNPYFLAFYWVFQVILGRQAYDLAKTGINEPVEILFDDGLDRKERLKIAFDNFVGVAHERNPEYLDMLINKEAEFRDDKRFMPLQACDLLAWHVRRLCYEGARGKKYNDPIWIALKEATPFELFPFNDTLMRMRALTWKS